MQLLYSTVCRLHSVEDDGTYYKSCDGKRRQKQSVGVSPNDPCFRRPAALGLTMPNSTDYRYNSSVEVAFYCIAHAL